jgi:hypothetical protein
VPVASLARAKGGFFVQDDRIGQREGIVHRISVESNDPSTESPKAIVSRFEEEYWKTSLVMAEMTLIFSMCGVDEII